MGEQPGRYVMTNTLSKTGTQSSDPEELVRVTTEAYDHGATEFHQHYYPQDGAYPNRMVMLGLAIFVKELKARAEAGTVLDVGCGPGEHVAFIGRSTGLSVTGVDRSIGMLTLARDRFRDIALARMDVRTLGFIDESFDGIWASSVVHHLPRRHVSAFFKELARIARPGCLLYLITREGVSAGIVGRNEETPFAFGPRYVSRLKAEEVAAYARSAGFDVAKSTTPGDDCVHLIATRSSDASRSHESQRARPMPRGRSTAVLDEQMLNRFACPQCKVRVTLIRSGTALECTQCRRVYPIDRGVPMMVLEEAMTSE
jgi:SAM-dependent methyltransferase/uncharacterized protein YbaR (Trm112 family)